MRLRRLRGPEVPHSLTNAHRHQTLTGPLLGAGTNNVAEGLKRQLTVWNRICEEIRPHQALGYLTPNEFYAKWVAEQATATTGVSEMS